MGIYLHAGTREGARRLGLDTSGPTLGVDEIPKGLCALTPREIEDVLCIYKDALSDRASGVPTASSCDSQGFAASASAC
jgi:hypothetical protein